MLITSAKYTTEVYLGPCQTFMVEFFAKLVISFKAWCLLKGHTYLNKPAAESCRFVLSMYDL